MNGASKPSSFGLLLTHRHVDPIRFIPLSAGAVGGEPHPESGVAAARDRVGPADRHDGRPAHHPEGAQRGGQGAQAQVEAGQSSQVMKFPGPKKVHIHEIFFLGIRAEEGEGEET